MSGAVSSEEFLDLVAAFRASLAALHDRGAYAVSGRLGLPDGPAQDVEADLDSGPADTASEALGKMGGGELGTDAKMEPTAATAEARDETLAAIREHIGDCQRCELGQSRTNLVFGTGSETASLMFVGEAPGAEEDRLGQPFVGPSGQLLDKMIVAMGWTRETVYIANVLKCRPPQNRDPKTAEIAACEGFLARQIRLVSPSVIVTLGKPAAHLLLRSTASMGSLRGVWQSYEGVAVMPTYHPAYLLRDPSKKRETWTDLQQVMARLKTLGIESG